jgi:hypothetical protein
MSVTNFYYNFKNKLGLYDLLQRLDPNKLWRIRIDEYDEKTRLQEEKYHAMLGDIAKQAKHLNQALDLDSWKRLCVDQYRKDCITNEIPRLADYWKRQNFRLMPGLDGSSLVALGTQTRDFPKYVAAGFIEWLYHYGSVNEIEWSEPQEEFDERYAA